MGSQRKKIAIIGGDGIGPERHARGEAPPRALPRQGGPAARSVGARPRRRPLPPRRHDVPEGDPDRDRKRGAAVLLGALGDPRVPGLEHARDILFGLRFGLDLYANVRPVKALADRLVPLKGRTAKDIDFVVFRENTEGIYVGIGGQFKRGHARRGRASTRTSTRARASSGSSARRSSYAKTHGKKRVHMADKSNAMKHAHELWHRVFVEVREGVPGHRGAARLRRRALPLPGPGPVAVRGHRHEQPVRRHRDRPRRGAAGRPRHGGERQRARVRPGARRAVRAGARLGAAARRQGPREPLRGVPHGRHDAHPPRLAGRGEAHRAGGVRGDRGEGVHGGRGRHAGDTRSRRVGEGAGGEGRL